MNVLCFIDNLGSGGAQRQIVNLALLLSEKGYNIRFLTYGKSNFFKDMLDDAQIAVDIIESIGPIDRIVKIRKYIRTGDQDLIISFLETPNFLACLSAIGGRRWKLITNERSAKNSSFNGFRGRVFKWFERFSDKIVCNSVNAQKMWERYYPRYIDKLTTIYNTVMLPDVNLINSTKREEKLNLVIAASYQNLKNMDGLIEAVNMLDNEYKNKLLVNWYGRIEVTAGNTEAYEEAIAKIERYGLTNIFLNDVTKEIIQVMSNADFICLFSKVEGLPNAICEGMFLGKPIIMTKVSDYNILIDDSNGLLCDANNPESIKEALQKAVDLSINERNQLGYNSMQRAKKLFGKEVITKQWIDLINSLD